MVIYVYKKMEKREKIGYANNIISGVINEQINDKKQREKYVSSYNLLKKLFFANTKKPHCSKEDMWLNFI